MKEIKINEIEGFKIGHAQDVNGGTGCTAIICEKGAAAGCDVRGGAPATRETDGMRSENSLEFVNCIVFSGGSAYGAAADQGVREYLEEKNIGFDGGAAVVPIVAGASIFDLEVGDPKCRPDRDMGRKACENAGGEVASGNVGAGTGATIGKYRGPEHMMKSGLGTYAVQTGEVKCGGIVSVNCLGDVFDVDTGEKIAGVLNDAKDGLGSTLEIMFEEVDKKVNVFSGNTTIGCIITNAKLTKAQLNKIASMTHNGYARAIKPVHTSADGDTIFIMSTCEVEVSPDAFGALSAYVMSKAIGNAVMSAEPAFGLKCAKDFK